MKRIIRISVIVAIAGLSSIVIYSCSKGFLERPPAGQLDEFTLRTRDGVNGLLTGAYALLDGAGLEDWLVMSNNTTVWNPWAGSVAADESHKGGAYPSQTERSELESKSMTNTNSILENKWRLSYAGVQRSNDVLRTLALVPEGEVTTAEATQFQAEARFLRAVYHFDCAKMWKNVPFVDESVTLSNGNYKVPNNENIYPKIEADIQFAIDNLPATQTDRGRTNSWAAKAFLCKVYMQQGKLAEAKPVLEDVLANGVTTSGQKYDLLPEYSQLWRAQYENGPESVFAVQMSVNDGSGGKNGNEGETSNYPDALGGWGNQPSFNLVNAYKTENGYPIFDAGSDVDKSFNDVDVTNDMGQEPTLPFTTYAGTLDPRLDWTVARRDIPFHDYGVKKERYNPFGGPYRGKKWTPWKADVGGANGELVGSTQYNGNNFCIIRFADVILWAAEVEVEIGDLQKAEDYVNRVRNRAANPSGFLHTYLNNSDPMGGFSTTNAATYDIKPYSGTDGFVAKGQDFARKAVRFERRLEFALEGGRFFDLQRYDLQRPGYMSDLLNDYMQKEVLKWETYIPGQTYEIQKNAVFTKGKNEIYPIPQTQIDKSNTDAGQTLTQNPGY